MLKCLEGSGILEDDFRLRPVVKLLRFILKLPIRIHIFLFKQLIWMILSPVLGNCWRINCPFLGLFLRTIQYIFNLVSNRRYGKLATYLPAPANADMNTIYSTTVLNTNKICKGWGGGA